MQETLALQQGEAVHVVNSS